MTTCYDRIVYVLESAQELDKKEENIAYTEIYDNGKNDEDIYGIICKYYKRRGDLKQFYCDYHEFIRKMDDDDQNESYNHDRIISTCKIFL